MSEDTETKYVVLSKLTVKDIGNPRKILAFDKGSGHRHHCGSIMGIAESVKLQTMKNPDGTEQKYEAIVGTFEGVSSDGTTIVNSAKLFLPGGFHESLTVPLNKNGCPPIKFGFDIYTVESSNAVGYSYVIEPFLKPEGVDPLKDLRAIRATKALPFPTSETAPKLELRKADKIA